MPVNTRVQKQFNTFNICLSLLSDRLEGDRSEGSGQENDDEQ